MRLSNAAHRGRIRAANRTRVGAAKTATQQQRDRMSAARNPRYWIEKRAQRKSGYPLATLAYYGPDASFASKVVVGIVTAEQEDEPAVV